MKADALASELDVVEVEMERAGDRAHGLPPGFTLTEDSLFCDGVRVCDRIEVLGLTRNDGGDDWGRWVRFRDPDGNEKTLAIPARHFSIDMAQLLGDLRDLGLGIETHKDAARALISYLGWSGGTCQRI
jgi:hypothetical protein